MAEDTMTSSTLESKKNIYEEEPRKAEPVEDASQETEAKNSED